MTHTLETAMADLCAKHDCRTLSVTCYAELSEASRYCVNLHYEGYSQRGFNVSSSHGATITEALGKVITAMQADRGIGCDVDALPALECAA
jgi:hypothetical protein